MNNYFCMIYFRYPKIFLLVLIGLCVFPDLNGQNRRQPLNKKEVRLKNQMKNDKDFKLVDCISGRGARAKRGKDKLRVEAFQKLKAKKGKIKIKQTCSTIEGTPIYLYLTIDNGRASLFIDTSEDNYGYQKVYSYKCSDLELGKYFYDKKNGKWNFQKSEDLKENTQNLRLRCLFDKKELFF